MSGSMIRVRIIGFIAAVLCGFTAVFATLNPDGRPRPFIGFITAFLAYAAVAAVCLFIEARKKRSVK